MLRRHVSRLRRANFAVDLLLTLTAFIAATLISEAIHGQAWRWGPAFEHHRMQAALALLSLAACVYLRDERYIYRLRTIRDFARESAILTLGAGGTLLALVYFTKLPPLPRSQFLTFMTLQGAGLLLTRVTLLKILHHFRARGRNKQKTLVVGTRDRVREVVDSIAAAPQWGMEVVGLVIVDADGPWYRYRDIPLVGRLGDLPEVVKKNHVDIVMFSAPASLIDSIHSAMAVCERMGAQVCLQADFLELQPARHQVIDFAGRPAIMYSRTPEPGLALLAKSTIDRVAAGVGLILLAPFFVAIAAAIKRSSPGPIFFRQVRCGLHGRRFEMIKFRTMVADAERLKDSLKTVNEMDGPAFKIKLDPRVTPVGRILRKLSLDELPQLINILRGEMSLVGPRPPLPEEVSRYDLWQRRKLSMRPGLTCLWQVGERNDCSFEKWMLQDLEYIDNWSLALDAKILLRTIPAVINATGR